MPESSGHPSTSVLAPREDQRDIDPREFYAKAKLDPDKTFNKDEITLSHLFRRPLELLAGRNYSDCLVNFFADSSLLRPQVIEVGGGLGHVARNFLDNARGRETVTSYKMVDLCPILLDRQRENVGDRADEFVRIHANELHERFPTFRGLVLCNGVIADLRSFYVEDEQAFRRYVPDDPEIEAFVSSWLAKRGPTYVHYGSLEFLRALSQTLRDGGCAAILEYAATPKNQPSWFKNHYECGIDFDQIEDFANMLGFDTDVVDIEGILGISKDQPLLSVDVFTRQDRMVHDRMGLARLFRKSKKFEVLAYTPESIGSVLEEVMFADSASERDLVLDALSNCFHSIHSDEFDTKNPTTWGYKCLTLRGRQAWDWETKAHEITRQVYSDLFGVSASDSERILRQVRDEARMGGDIMAIVDAAGKTLSFGGAAIIGGLIYDGVKWASPRALRWMVRRWVKEKLPETELSTDTGDDLLRSLDKHLAEQDQ